MPPQTSPAPQSGVPTPLSPVPTNGVPLQTAPPQPQPDRKRFPKWLKVIVIIAAVFIALIVTAVIIATQATKAPQKISDAFVNDVQAGNTAAAYQLTSKPFQQATSQQQLDDLIKRVGPGLQGNEKITGRRIEKSTSYPETAVLVYTIPTSNGNAYVKTELQQSDGAWQIINFTSDNKPLSTEIQ